jgi:hypothetical protein
VFTFLLTLPIELQHRRLHKNSLENLMHHSLHQQNSLSSPLQNSELTTNHGRAAILLEMERLPKQHGLIFQTLEG